MALHEIVPIVVPFMVNFGNKNSRVDDEDAGLCFWRAGVNFNASCLH
jgi:hypothetical protein